MRRPPISILGRTVLAASLGSAVTAHLSAQSAAAAPVLPAVQWKSTIDANGTVLYGAGSQRVFAIAAGASRAGKRFELRFDGLSAYGDSKDPSTGVRSITVRNSRLSSNFDWHPDERWSPFALASAESNYQQRYASRVATGVGAKLTFWRPDTVVAGFVQDASVSLAVLNEDTRALEGAPLSADAGTGRRGRWSLRVRYRTRITQSLQFMHLTLYQPEIHRLEHYTLESVTELTMPLSTTFQFTIAHHARLDSEARTRGAASIQDGQVLFGIRANF